ncbi:alanine racemase [Sandaracinus amylolyticus]|uniref:alanine racemase n=1 Tax=Sandaracinus amylolyticus TaxID=927083 RepID=UPI001F2BA24F|nr:alanine racemase [Sandaracinus amylolyticus]UJR80184.1 D-serine deaminase, pyridoxal phosphate-dependent [Sandaracinus amylolyticus]
MDWDDFRRALAFERLPCALVDLDALERNVDRVRARIAGTGRTVRVASKSVRHRGVLRRVLDRGGDAFRGLLCYSADEAAWLASHGFDDLLIAYPTVQRAALDAVAQKVALGATIRCIVDSSDHLEALGAAARRASISLDAVLDLDVSYRPLGGRAHLGVRRSPLRSAEDVGALARAAKSVPGVRVVGLMAYEAHVAGLPDASASAGAAKNAAVRALKSLAIPAVRALRGAAVSAMRAEWPDATLVNGGGTGSIEVTAADPAVTEVAVGSGFLCSHLFDGYAGLDLEPAQFFALEVARVPDRDHVTCAYGGYVASGTPGIDRLPMPWSPRGLAWVGLEGAGEVQSPLRVDRAERRPRIGDPVIFRHAKAGEMAERFREYLMVRGDAIEAREPTYRGEGTCFG